MNFGIGTLERDDFSSSHHPALAFCLCVIFSENRCPLFGITHWTFMILSETSATCRINDQPLGRQSASHPQGQRRNQRMMAGSNLIEPGHDETIRQRNRKAPQLADAARSPRQAAAATPATTATTATTAATSGPATATSAAPAAAATSA